MSRLNDLLLLALSHLYGSLNNFLGFDGILIKVHGLGACTRVLLLVNWFVDNDFTILMPMPKSGNFDIILSVKSKIIDKMADLFVILALCQVLFLSIHKRSLNVSLSD